MFQDFHDIASNLAICGGDLVHDAAAVSSTRPTALFDLYKQTSAAITLCGALHDRHCGIFGVLNKNGVAPSDPRYGKKAFEDRFGPTHYSFDYKGMALRCARLNLPARRPYLDGRIGEEQIA